MKKTLSFLLVICLFASMATGVYAAGSPKPNPVVPQTIEVIVTDDAKVDVEKGTYPIESTIPAESVKQVAVNQADKLLGEEDAAAFKAAYEEAMAMDDCKVYKCFWLYVDEDLAGEEFKGVSVSSALAIKFSCPGKDVKFFVNGNEMKVIHEKGASYVAILTETGTVTITCAK